MNWKSGSNAPPELNFGYFYNSSPIIAYDGEPHPRYSMTEFTSSTVPGCRAPHLWLSDRRSLYDALGPYYTVIRIDPAVDLSGMIIAADRRGVPSLCWMSTLRRRNHFTHAS